MKKCNLLIFFLTTLLSNFITRTMSKALLSILFGLGFIHASKYLLVLSPATGNTKAMQKMGRVHQVICTKVPYYICGDQYGCWSILMTERNFTSCWHFCLSKLTFRVCFQAKLPYPPFEKQPESWALEEFTSVSVDQGKDKGHTLVDALLKGILMVGGKWGKSTPHSLHLPSFLCN